MIIMSRSLRDMPGITIITMSPRPGDMIIIPLAPYTTAVYNTGERLAETRENPTGTKAALPLLIPTKGRRPLEPNSRGSRGWDPWPGYGGGPPHRREAAARYFRRLEKIGAPGGTRTHDPEIRNPWFHTFSSRHQQTEPLYFSVLCGHQPPHNAIDTREHGC